METYQELLGKIVSGPTPAERAKAKEIKSIEDLKGIQLNSLILVGECYGYYQGQINIRDKIGFKIKQRGICLHTTPSNESEKGKVKDIYSNYLFDSNRLVKLCVEFN
ncbi:MAG: hypothetical protein WC781_03290 [Candidatus Pacearchaeota archaeon]|jgi:hypothetical protein